MFSGSSIAIRVNAGSGTPSAWKPTAAGSAAIPCFDVEGRRSHGQVEERALAVAESPEGRVKRLKPRGQSAQCLVHNEADRAQWVRTPNPPLKIDV